MDVYSQLKTLGIELPPPPPRGGNYAPVQSPDGVNLYISGCGPQIGDSAMTGKLGENLSIEEGKTVAMRCMLNALAALQGAIGDLNKVEQFVKLTVFVAGASDFYEQPKVANGATDLLVSLFGERGLPARSAVGMAALPGNIPVEIEAIVKIKE